MFMPMVQIRLMSVAVLGGLVRVLVTVPGTCIYRTCVVMFVMAIVVPMRMRVCYFAMDVRVPVLLALPQPDGKGH